MQACSAVRSYLLHTILAIIGYALIAGGLALVFRNLSLLNNPLLIGVFVIVLTLLFNPFRKQLQQNIDWAFFGNQATQQELLVKFKRELNQNNRLQNIVSLLRKHIIEGLNPSTIHIFLHDNLSDQYTASADENNNPTSDLRFPRDTQLHQIAQGRGKVVLLGDPNTLKKLPHSDQSRLNLLAGALIAFLPRAHGMVGWVVLGPKTDRKSYIRSDLQFLERLCALASPALDQAQIVLDLEWRVREMDILSRVAQAVNVTPAFNDMLEDASPSRACCLMQEIQLYNPVALV